MDGVAILDTGTKVLEYGWGWSWVGLIFIIISLISLVATGLCLSDGDISGYVFFITSVLLIILAMILFSHAKETKIVSTYKVTIDDSVSMVEFYDRYEILEVEGKIYTVMERVE